MAYWKSKLKVKRLFLGTTPTEVTVTPTELNAFAGMTATADELAYLDASVNGAIVAGGANFTGTGAVYKSAVERIGGIVKTTILLDLTGMSSGDGDKDVCGTTGTANYITQITTAKNGSIYGGQVSCLEVPTTGADDLDFYMASVGNGAFDADGSALTDAASLITKGGAWAIDGPTAMTAPITADYYLYLLNGEAVAGTWDAGRFLIELWGV